MGASEKVVIEKVYASLTPLREASFGEISFLERIVELIGLNCQLQQRISDFVVARKPRLFVNHDGTTDTTKAEEFVVIVVSSW